MSPAPSLELALQWAVGLGLARIDAQMLLLHSVGQPTHQRAWLITHDRDVLSSPQWTAFQNACERRAAGEPVAYITERKAFFALDLHITPSVLDPRPDTETLVEWALELLTPESHAAVLDLGTGSGAIALALKAQRPHCALTAVDASLDALAVARSNSEGLHLPITLRHGNWFAPVAGLRFDLIVSNPPYLAADDAHLPALRHEPLAALVAGADGLDDIRHIIATAPQHLQAGAWLLLEHGYEQAAAVQALLQAAGFGQLSTRADLAGQPRCTGGRMPSSGTSSSTSDSTPAHD